MGRSRLVRGVAVHLAAKHQEVPSRETMGQHASRLGTTALFVPPPKIRCTATALNSSVKCLRRCSYDLFHSIPVSAHAGRKESNQRDQLLQGQANSGGRQTAEFSQDGVGVGVGSDSNATGGDR